MLDLWGVPAYNVRTYFRHQKSFLLTGVYNCWKQKQGDILKDVLQTGRVKLASDGRCDSPGHNAMFCLVSFMDTRTKKIIGINLAQV
jgi:hypothetical protein